MRSFRGVARLQELREITYSPGSQRSGGTGQPARSRIPCDLARATRRRDVVGTRPMPTKVWLSTHARPLEPEDATISVFDRGFLYGDSVYETLRTSGGNVVELPA